MDMIVKTDNVIGMSRQDVIARLNEGETKWMVPSNIKEGATTVICVEANRSTGSYFSIDFDHEDKAFRVRIW